MLAERCKRILLAIAVISTCISIWFTFAHIKFPFSIFLVSTIASYAMAFVCTYEVFVSKKIQLVEKVLWTLGFLVIGIFVMVPYFIRARKRIFVITVNSTT
jgi:uncharacterized membrane protein